MIRFSVAGIPVRVRPTFWLVALLLGLGAGPGPILLAWVVIVFVSVLGHELGHALTARRFGADVSITLTTFGGYTQWSTSKGMSAGRRALVAGAGSGVGIVVGLAVLGVFLMLRPLDPFVANVTAMFVWVNVGWGVLNWLPIRPLDGGHLLLAFLEMVAPRHSDRIAPVIFVGTGLAALGVALYFDLIFAAMLAGFMTWMEVSRFLPSPASSREPLEFSYDDPPPEEDARNQEDGRPLD